MNRQLYRVIFNAARGMRMVVQETATATGKGSNKATTVAGGALAGAAAFAPMLIGAALAGMLSTTSAQAQIVGAPNVPGNLRPTVLVAPNGVPYVNIQTPSAAGVSRNVYNQFNIGNNGAILNNSRVNVQSQLGGYIQGNPFLATGPARIIVNEVNGGNPSQIRGYLEVAGQRAEIIIANPAGISIDGGGFINASRATVTTGTPQFNAIGGLDSFLVRGGTVTIDGAGLDASKTDYAAILARAVQLNAAIYATDLKVVTGANQISADHALITPTTGSGTAPTFALDSSALGGMYANKITMIGTEAGLGVRNAGNIGASNGNLIVTAAGRLENTGTLEGTRVELASTGDIDNRGGTIRQTSSAGLTISSPTLSNTNGGVIGVEPASTASAGGGASTGGSTGTDGTTTTPSTSTAGSGSGSSGSTAASAPAPFIPTSPGTITATGAILNDGGKIFAGGPIALQTPQINNAGGNLNVATMAVTGSNFSNAGGTLNVSNSFSANVGQLDNTGGKLNAGSLNIATSGDLVNTDGVMTSATDANLTVGGKTENTRGSISAAGALTANVTGATINNSGTLASNQALALSAGSLENTQGNIQSAQAGVQLGVTNALANGSGGSIKAATDLGIQAGSLVNGGSLRGGNDANITVGGALTNDGSVTAGRNTTITAGSVQSGTASVLGAGIQSDGKLGGAGDLRVTTTGALIANGTNLAAGNAALQGASVDLSAGQTSATNIAITATQGNVTTSKATVVTPGTLSVTANAQPGQTLVNEGGKLSANQLDLKVSNIANTQGGEIVQTGTGATHIVTSGAIDNSGGMLASNGSLAFTAASLNNKGGTLRAAQTSDLTVTVAGLVDNRQGEMSAGGDTTLNAGSLDNSAGRFTAAGDVSSTTSGATNNRGGTIAANGNTVLNAGSLDNTGGTVSALNTLTANVQGAVDNTAGTLVANQTLVLNAGSLVNDKGSIQSTQATTGLNVTGALANGSGYVGAAADLSVKAGSLANAGSLRGINDTTVAVTGELTNDGSITAGRNTTVNAGSVQSSTTGVLGAGIQSDGKLGAAGDLSVSASGALVAHGTNLAATNATLQGASVDVSASQTSAANIAVTATQGDVITSKATVVTPGTLAITANSNAAQTLVNDAGKLNAKQIDLKLSNLANTNSGEIVQFGTGATAIAMSGTLNNDGGRIASNGNLALDAASLSNRSGSVQTAPGADISLTARALANNSGGDILAGRDLYMQAGALSNDSGRITATGDISSVTSGAASNRGGVIAANGSTVLNAASLDNAAGTVSGVNRVSMDVAGALDNSAGTVVANQALVLDAGSLDNAKGVIQSLQSTARVGVAEALKNNLGQIGAASDLDVKAGSVANTGSLRGANDTTVAVDGQLANDGSITAGRNTTITAGSLNSSSAGVLGAGIQSDGKLASTGDLRVTTSGALIANGNNIAAGNATLQGASADLAGSKTSATNIAVTATQGDVITSKATVVTPGTLAITANSNAAQTLANDAGKLNASQLQINVSNLANTNSGEIVQTGTGATTIAMGGTLNNDGGRIASNGQDLTLQAAAITNNAGRIEHAGNGTLSIAGGSFNGTNGQITTNHALTVATSSAFNQDGGTTSAKQITIDADSLSNRGGQIVQIGANATHVTVVGALDNGNAGVIASNGNTTISAGRLSNQGGGSIRAAQTSSLALNVGGLLDNSNKGVIGAGGNTTIAAGSLNNNAGSATAVGDLNATIAGAASNVAGTWAANGNTTVAAASLDNSAGTTAAVNGNLSVTTQGATTNSAGTLQAGGVTTLGNGGLVNQGGKVFGNSLSIDTHGNTLDNSANGTMAATTTVAISSGMLLNDASLIQSGGAMTINTNGQSLSNTNAAGYSNQQGGITSADALDLKTGAVNNSAGFIGSKNALTASTQAVTNTNGGIVLGQSTVAVNTNGAAYDNGGGKTQAVGDLSINAADIQNSGGLVRSLATTTLNAGAVVNTNTQGTDQGIEGKNVVIGTGNLNNDTGAIRADVNATITSGGSVSNRSGLISAGDTLAIVDPNAASPGAKTLNLVNTNGTLVADKSVKIDAATFSGDGKLLSGKDLSIALTQDIVNNGEVAANGNLSYTTTGSVTNNGKLLAGQTLTVGGNNVDNTANAEMSGTETTVNASGALTNRGLIDSQGKTQINAGTLNNIGTGRIYGDDVSIAAGTLNNDAETVSGVTKAGTIAARGDLDIGATTVNNREHALIFSQGNMAIGGALDANRRATGQGSVLNNLSADIESIGNMDISMANVNNRDLHIQKGAPTVTNSALTGIAPINPVGSGVGRTTPYPLDEVNVDPANGFVYRKDTGELVGIGGYGIWYNAITTTEDTAINADPARLVAGGNMNVNGHLYNENSQVLAGGTITATSYQSSQLSGTRTVTGSATVIDNAGQVQMVNIPLVLPPQTISLGHTSTSRTSMAPRVTAPGRRRSARLRVARAASAG
nr:filamentous hemagglutinin N-terminal domain-containing protein [Variovorax boronicumulans]